MKIADLPKLEIDAREALILSLRHGLNPPASYEFVGRCLGVSKEFARHLDSKVIHKVRSFAGKTYPVRLDEIE